MQPGWCQPVRQEFMENECEALPGVAYPGVRDNRSTINTKTGYEYDAVPSFLYHVVLLFLDIVLYTLFFAALCDCTYFLCFFLIMHLYEL